MTKTTKLLALAGVFLAVIAPKCDKQDIPCVVVNGQTICSTSPEVSPPPASPSPVEPSTPPTAPPTAPPTVAPPPTTVATPPPTPIPPTPIPPSPSPSPCTSKPQCMKKGDDGSPVPSTGCISCAKFLSQRNFKRDGAYLYFDGSKGREWLDPQTCYFIYSPADPRTRNKRYINDGSVCDVGCSPNPQPCTPSPQPSPRPSPSVPPNPTNACQLAPGARNYPLLPGMDTLPQDGGFCPDCYPRGADLVTHCGVTHKATQPRHGTGGRRYIFDVTCHTGAPFCPHRPDQQSCDVVWGCQECPEMYQTGPGFVEARVDRHSANCFFGQIHISNPAENGQYEIYACAPGTRPGHPSCRVWRGYVGTDGPLKLPRFTIPARQGRRAQPRG